MTTIMPLDHVSVAAPPDLAFPRPSEGEVREGAESVKDWSGNPPAVRQPHFVAWHGTRLSGAELDAAIDHIVLELGSHGVSSGDTVVLESDDSGRTVLSLLALAALNCPVVLVDHAERFSADANVTLNPSATVVLRGIGRPKAGVPELLDLRSALTDIERGRTARQDVSETTWNQWFLRSEALGIFSSGTTTGVPALVWKSGAELHENALATAHALGYDNEDVFLPLLPLSGQYGSSAVLIAWVIGAGITTSKRQRVGEAMRMIRRNGVTAVDAPPRIYRSMIEELRRRPGTVAQLKEVRLFGVGGEGVSELLLRDFHEETGRGLIDGYGLTQLGNVAFSEPAVPCEAPGPRVLKPLDTFRIAVVDNDGLSVPDSTPGRIMVGRSDGNPVRDECQWFDTGDVGHSTHGGIVVAGRDGMAIRNGTLVPFAWIESQLFQAGIEAYAVAAPGETGTRIWLIVHDPLHRSTEHWRERIGAVLAPDQLPDSVQVLGELPFEESGKVSRRRLEGLAVGLQKGRGRRRRDRLSALGRVRSVVLANRQELMELVARVSDTPTAQHDFRAMVNVLDSAEGELNLHTTPQSAPVDVFMARNALLESFAIYCVVPSLWARRIRIRPATGTEVIIQRLIELLRDVCPVSLDFCREPQQDFVQRVAAEPSVVLFTGHRSNAEDVLRCLSRHHLFIYFGRGVNPVVVFPDADLERASKEIVYSRLYNGGQDCLAPDIVLVHEHVVEELTRLLSRDAAGYVETNGGALAPLTKETDLLDAVRYLTQNADGMVSGGSLRFGERTFDPAVVRVDGEAQKQPHEHFSPILSVASFTNAAEATELLRSDYYRENGFGTAVYGGSEAFTRALTDIGMVAWGQSLVAGIAPFEPFGGYGVESGFVQHQGRRTLGPISITRSAVQWGASMKEGKRA